MKELDNLRDAFPAMPEECRHAMINAARSAKEEEHMKRKSPVAILVAAILMMMTTVAIAEGWNVLQFLGIQPDNGVQKLVQPVSASGKASNVTLTIDSAITDGEYLVFDYTVSNADPGRPVYLNVEEFTINSQNVWYSFQDTAIDNQWLPGFSHPASAQGGCIIPLTAWMPALTDDMLHVDLVVAVHTAVNPVYMLEANHFNEALDKLNEGYTVIVGNNRFACYSDDPIPGSLGVAIANGTTSGAAIHGTERTTLTLSFDLDMKAARALMRKPAIPSPAYSENVRITLESFTVSPLQIRLTAVATWADDAPVGLSGKFILRDKGGTTIKVKAVSDSPETYTKTYGRDTRFTNKETVFECAIIAPTGAMPEEADLVFRLNDGTEISLPLIFR